MATNCPQLLISPSSMSPGIPRRVTFHRPPLLAQTTSSLDPAPQPESAAGQSTFPRTWPRSLMLYAPLRVKPGRVPRSSRPPLSVQKKACDVQIWVQLVPTTCPRSLIAIALLQVPPITPTSTSSYLTSNSSTPTPFRPRKLVTPTSYFPVSASAAMVRLAISFVDVT